jgi:hypothetical protein
MEIQSRRDPWSSVSISSGRTEVDKYVSVIIHQDSGEMFSGHDDTARVKLFADEVVEMINMLHAALKEIDGSD